MNSKQVTEHISKWLKDYLKTSKANGFVVGVSGGIDSAVVSTLCAKTGINTILLEMPIHQSKEQVNRAKVHIEMLKKSYKNVSSFELNLTEPYDSFIRSIENVVDLNGDVDQKMLTLSNTRSRLRMVALYSIAGVNKYLVVGTGNKVEDFGVGFYTKYGDGAVDISPIADLMKSEVYELGKFLGVNEHILNARPTDGLWDDGRTDEDQIGATYDELEWAMNFVENNWHWETGMENGGFLDYSFKTDSTIMGNLKLNLTDREKEVLKIYLERHNANKHKMVEIPVCYIPNEVKN
jgi:NAD+ synthase